MRAVTLRGSWPPSCRTGPGPHGTWRARPASVPQPTGAPIPLVARGVQLLLADASNVLPIAVVGGSPTGLKDYHTLCPGTGVGVPPRWAVVVPGHNGVQCRLQQLGIVHVCSRNHNAQGTALSIHKEISAWYQPCHGPSGWAQSGPPKTCLAHGSVCRLPFPVHATQLFAPLHKGSPHSVQDTRLHPP